MARQFIMHYPPGETLFDNGERKSHADIAEDFLADLRAGKDIAIPHCGWRLTVITDGKDEAVHTLPIKGVSLSKADG